MQLLRGRRHDKWKAELQQKKLTHLAFDTVHSVFPRFLENSQHQCLTCKLQVSWVRHWEALLAMMFDTLAEELPPHHMVAALVHGTM